MIQDTRGILTYFNIFSSEMLLTSEIQSFVISSLKLWSTSLVFLVSPSHSSLHFGYDSYFAFANFQILIPFFLRLDPQPDTAQFSPSIITT